ncbi:MAG TPA: hypothetical protein DEG71_09360 [Clostridiales bacterium]|nr:hypothetical protein [Clostridiales bacterium]
MALATRFGRNSNALRSNIPLDNSQLFRIAPSIFANEAHESRSARYTYIPTIDVLDGLRKEGFQPFFVAQSRSRIEGKSEFTKHMLRLRQVGEIEKSEANEIILINSHDGTSSYQMMAGCFRFVCQNGMVTGDIVEDIRVRHKGNIVHNVIDAAFTIVDNFEAVNESVDGMKSTLLLPAEQELFAEAALSLKYDENEAPITPNQLLSTRRIADRNPDLWSNFNRVQENIIRGGLRGRTANGNRTTTREVKSIDNNVKLNKALWILADGMRQLKNGIAV